MPFRNHLRHLQSTSHLRRITQPVSKTFEIAGILKALEPTPVIFENVRESGFSVLGNSLSSKGAFAKYLDIHVRDLIPTLTKAIEARQPADIIASAPCQEIVITEPNLDDLPILKHCENDGGNYITSGVVIARHPKYGQNVDFHRCMQISKSEMAMRVVRSRNFDTFLQDRNEVDVALCIGTPPSVLIAAATSIALGSNELDIANALEPLEVVRAKTVDVLIPAESEFVLEGTVYLDRRHPEGPFVDLTETYDIVRQEPIFVVHTITHRTDAIWHALLPGGLEHKLLMGMPREPTVFREVSKVVRCLDVNISPGGCSWLHAIVQIDKKNEDDGLRAIEATFAGHRSCKHVFIVDNDIDIYNPLEIEWAMATRFQGNTRMVVKEREPGSSLDPSGDEGSKLTTKIGFDLTKPLNTHGKTFEKAVYPQVDLSHYFTN
jgi:UbiD family decarboxylase